MGSKRTIAVVTQRNLPGMSGSKVNGSCSTHKNEEVKEKLNCFWDSEDECTVQFHTHGKVRQSGESRKQQKSGRECTDRRPWLRKKTHQPSQGEAPRFRSLHPRRWQIWSKRSEKGSKKMSHSSYSFNIYCLGMRQSLPSSTFPHNVCIAISYSTWREHKYALSSCFIHIGIWFTKTITLQQKKDLQTSKNYRLYVSVISCGATLKLFVASSSGVVAFWAFVRFDFFWLCSTSQTTKERVISGLRRQKWLKHVTKLMKSAKNKPSSNVGTKSGYQAPTQRH